jgi:hypothetical protein
MSTPEQLEVKEARQNLSAEGLAVVTSRLAHPSFVNRKLKILVPEQMDQLPL